MAKDSQPVIDLSLGTIGGQAFRPQTLEVLKLLHSRAGQLVTKDEMMNAVWPGIAVTDDSLVQCITEIRKAFGEAGHAVIKTVPKRGYVFKPAPQQPAEKPAIAVLPFKNLGFDEQSNKLASLMTEDVITDLSHSRDLLVIARTSTEAYGGKPVDVRQIGRDLNVAYVLEGSVLTAGDRIRATAQLIETNSGNHVWAERYERDAKDIFAVESEIVEKISVKLASYQGAVAEAERKISRRKPPSHMKAHDYYLLGAEQKHLMTRESLIKAKALLDQSIALDPGFARAYVALAWVHTINFSSGYAESSESEKANLIQAAKKAVELDPGDGEAHVVLALAHFVNNDFAKAAEEMARGEELAPGNADILAQTSSIWSWLGQPERAAANADKALRLNPTFPDWYLGIMIEGYYFSGRFADTVKYGERNPAPNSFTLALTAASYAKLGRHQEAARTIAKILASEPNWNAEQFLIDTATFQREQEADKWFGGVKLAGGPACMTVEAAAKVEKRLLSKYCERERSRNVQAAQ